MTLLSIHTADWGDVPYMLGERIVRLVRGACGCGQVMFLSSVSGVNFILRELIPHPPQPTQQDWYTSPHAKVKVASLFPTYPPSSWRLHRD